MDLKQLLAASVAKIVEQFPKLSVEQLQELKALEQADPSPRSTLIEAIDKAVATLASPPAEAPKATVPADWKHPDYVGPLDCEKAAWRNANLKPAEQGITK